MIKEKFKSVFSKTFIVVASVVALWGIDVNALSVKETVGKEIADGSYIIGVTRFTPDQNLTAAKLSKAVANDMIYHRDDLSYEGPEIYFYLAGWLRLNDDGSTTKVTNVPNTLDIFYINNVEKMITLNYRMTNAGSTLSYNTIPSTKAKYVEYANGVLNIPSTISNISILEDGTEIQKYNRVDGVDSIYTPVVLGSIGRDDDNIGGTNLTATVTDTGITFNGEIAWYGKNSERDTVGNRIGVKISAPAGFTTADLANTTVKVNGTSYAWSSLSNTVSLTWVEVIDSIEATGNTYDIEVVWEEGVTQSFTVTVEASSTLAPAELGTISTTNGTLKDDTLTITGEVAWNGRKSITLTAPNGYDSSVLTATRVTVGDKTYSWSEIASGTTATIELLLKDNTTPTIEVEWNSDNVQEFKIDATGVTYAAMPKGEILDVDDNVTATFTGDTVIFTGQNIPYNVFAGENGGNQIRIGFSNSAYDYSKGDKFTVIIDDYAGHTVIDDMDHLKNSALITFSKDRTPATVKVIWESGNEQEFTIMIGDRATFMDEPYGTIEHDIDSKYGDVDFDSAPDAEIGVATDTTVKDTILFYGDISYYRAANGYKAGNRVAVKITANEYFRDKLSGITVKHKNDDGEIVEEAWGTGMSYTFAPLVSLEEPTTTIEVIWATEEGKEFTQTFTVGILTTNEPGKELILYGAPRAEVKAIENANYQTSIDKDSVTITGSVPYISSTNSTSAGSIVKVELDLSGMFYTDAEKNAAKVIETIGENVVFEGTFATWNKNNIWEAHLDYTKKATLEIVWEDGNTQIIEIDATGASVEQAPSATITGGDYDYTTTITGNKVVISGKVPYIAEGDVTGNVVYIKVDPSAITAYTEDEINNASVTLKVGSSEATVTWAEFAALNDGAWYIPFAYGINSATMMITWEPGNTQIITIEIAEDGVLETKATDIQIADVDAVIGGDAAIINPSLTPDYATNEVTYRIVDETDAITLENGAITAIKYSETPITVEATIDGITTTFKVNTVFPEIDVESLDIVTSETAGGKVTFVTPHITGGSGSFKYTLLRGIDQVSTASDGNPLLVNEYGTFTLRIEDKVSGVIVDKTGIVIEE